MEANKPQSPQKGTSTILFGAVGTGKTTSLASVLTAHEVIGNNEQPFQLVHFVLDPNALPPMQQFLERPNYHQVRALVGGSSLGSLQSVASAYRGVTHKRLQEANGIELGSHNELNNLLKLLDAPKTTAGVTLPSISKLGTRYIIAIDGLSELCQSVSLHICGVKLAHNLPEYQAVQNLTLHVVQTLTNLFCHVVIIAHSQRTEDKVTGGQSITLAAFGQALSNAAGRQANDIILTRKEVTASGTKYLWSANWSGVDTKNQYIAGGTSLPPNFSSILVPWYQRTGKLIVDEAPSNWALSA